MSIVGTKSVDSTFNITYNWGLGAGPQSYNGTGISNVLLSNAYVAGDVVATFRDPVISTGVNGLDWGNTFTINGASAIENNTPILFTSSRIGIVTSVILNNCSFTNLSNTVVGNLTLLRIQNHQSSVTMDDSFWPQNLTSSNLGKIILLNNSLPYTISTDLSNMTNLNQFGEETTFSNNGLRSLSIALPRTFGINVGTNLNIFQNGVVRFTSTNLSAVTFTNASSVDGDPTGPSPKYCCMFLSNVDSLRTIGDLPYSMASFQIQGQGNTVAGMLSLTSVTTNFQPLFRLNTVTINRTRLNNANLSNTFSLAPAVLSVSFSFCLFTSIPQLPPTTTSLTMICCQINTQPSTPTFFPTSLKLLNLSNNASQTVLNNIPVWSHDMSYVTSLTGLSLNRVSMTSYTAPLPATIRTLDLSSNNLTSFNAEVFSASTGTSYVVSVDLSANGSLSQLTGLTNCGTLSEISTSSSNFPNQNAIDIFTSSSIKRWYSTSNGTAIGTWNKPFSPTMNYLELRRHGLNQASVDYILCWFLTGSSVNGGTLNLWNASIPYNCNQGGANCNSVPSGPSSTVNTGLWCKAQLESAPRNWIVNVPT